jgi:23S rRNA (uracil1939-C5)-methyltransferase
MVAGGRALARADDGRVTLVEGALPGETVEVEITTERNDLLQGRAVEVLEPSADRVAPPCAYAQAGCGGCGWQHITVAAQRGFKEEIIRDALHRIARIDDVTFRPTVELPDTGFRTTVRMATDDGRAAFRRHQSHDPIAVDSCLVAHPLIDEIIRDGRFGDADEVTIRVGAATGERCVTTDPLRADIDVPADVRRGPKAHVHEVIEGVTLRVSARAFFQARPDGAAALARLVRDAVGTGRRVADLYAGVGLLSATLDAPRHVVAVENNRFAVADARHNLQALDARVHELDVGRWRPEPVDVVIADPSRSGLGRPGAQTVINTNVDRVVLVLCDAPALARDAALLETAGYDIASITPVDLFPHTAHVECVTVFER